MAPDEIRSCVIVVTAWVERSDTDELRARFAVAASRAGQEERDSFATCGIDEACLRLRVWLERFSAGDCAT